jgi:glutamate racemase
MKVSAPIGVFDSGIGGLTVLRELMRLLPQEDTIYLGDTARVPYGIRSARVVNRYSLQNARFLLSQGIKLLVLACNTASATSLAYVQRALPVPVIGVIEPGARAALRASRSGRIGVVGTETTIRSKAYVKALKALEPSLKIFSQACPLFVPLAEEGWCSRDDQVALLVAERYLRPLRRQRIDTLVLGCTHYPLLRDAIAEVMGPQVVLIDSAAETARATAKLLKDMGLLRRRASGGRRSFFVTDSPQRFRALGRRFLGDGQVENVQLLEVMQ